MVQKNSAAPAPTRGRPRSFDTDEVLGRVRDTFWKYGYAGTSMDQLSAATGLHKPSLYGAFGDKKALYLAALDNYLAEVRAEFALAFAVPNLFESLDRVSECSIDKFLRGPRRRQRLLHDEHGDARSGQGSGHFEGGARRDGIARARVPAAASSGRSPTARFPATVDPNVLTMILVANHYEMSGRARAGYSRAELRTLADRAQDLVKSLVGHPNNDR